MLTVTFLASATLRLTGVAMRCVKLSAQTAVATGCSRRLDRRTHRPSRNRRVVIQTVFILRKIITSAPELAILPSLTRGKAAWLPAKGLTWCELVVTGTRLATSGMLFASGSAPIGNTVHENFRAANKSASVDFQTGDVVALPDPSMTTGAGYCLKYQYVDLLVWSRIAHQEQTERVQLQLDLAWELASPPPGVWLV